ncbi:MAG: ATP-binding protein [Cellvibrionales bacterium]|nr:ATP-binding protein [Cellvibrionales bacterium]
MKLGLNLGKYRGIVVSIALFLLLDASVLILNFYISFKIKDDAVAINLAGRQRMLSQKMMKSLLEIQAYQNNPILLLESTKRLQTTAELFNSTFNGFLSSGYTMDAKGDRVLLEKIESLKGQAIMSEAETLWAPWYTRLEIFLNISTSPNDPLFNSSLSEVIEYGEKNNLDLLAVMNNLTNHLQNRASSQANQLRMIQVMGISLAILNFFIIMFHFMRQLRSSDEQIFEAKQETDEILNTVKEGLFLLSEDLRIGSQHSAELINIFGRDDFVGLPFKSLLQDIISEKDLSTAESFIKLLFKKTIKQNLIKDLNPLTKVEIHILSDDNLYTNKYINFQFSRVVSNDKTISHVLVTATDITEQVELEKALKVAKGQNEQQLTLLSTLIHSNMDMIDLFIKNSHMAFNDINSILKNSAKTHQQHIDKANQIFSIIHKFKGDASALNLDQFVELAHQFEDQVNTLLEKAHLTGNDFLSLTIQLNALITHTENCENLVEKLRGLTSSTEAQAANAAQPVKRFQWDHLETLATTIATKQNKLVELTHSGLNDYDFSEEFLSIINTLSTQLIRNAISHGIETSSQRLAKNKQPAGLINIRLTKRANGQFEYSFQDDGSGLDIESIKKQAIAKGLISKERSLQLDDRAAVGLIFSPSLSTAETVDDIAGRGIGMYSIKELITKAGGKISVGFKPNVGTTFTIRLPSEITTQTEAA